MPVTTGVPLAPYTTLGLGGPARTLVEADTSAVLVRALAERDATGEPVLLLAGGSNVVLPDAGIDGTVLRVATRGVRLEPTGDGAVLARVAAGEPWTDVVALTVAEGLAGIECLAGIPGSAGATPVQNVGAYGQEVADTLIEVEVWDRDRGERLVLPAAACGFGYRTSRFRHRDRLVVLAVTLRLAAAGLSTPVRYAELARTLGVPVGARAPLGEVRDAVLALRRGKGMVVDPADPDTASAGSFFTNPVLDATGFAGLRARAGGDVPHFPADGSVKVPAAWLVEQAGFTRGYGAGRVGISTKHTLALVNRGGGTAAELLALAREIRDGVRDRFGVELVPEPVIVAQPW